MSYIYRKVYKKKDGTERVFEKEYNYSKQNSEKTKCKCGGSYDRVHRARHFRTKKHIRYINMDKTKPVEVIEHKDGKDKCNECGCYVVSLYYHKRTKKHLNNLLE